MSQNNISSRVKSDMYSFLTNFLSSKEKFPLTIAQPYNSKASIQLKDKSQMKLRFQLRKTIRI